MLKDLPELELLALEEARAERPRRFSRATIALWLIAISMVVFFVPLFLISSLVGENVKGLQGDLNLIRVSLTNVPTPPPEARNLLNALSQSQAQTNQINRTSATLAAGRADWPAVMTALGNYNPDELTIATLARADNRITLTGRAVREQVVTTYVRSLEQSGLFTRVTLQSLQLIATPVVTPTISRPGSTTPTATSTLTPHPTWTLIPSPTPLLTPTPSLTPTPTNTSVPTSTPTNTPTLAPTATPTLVPTMTFTPDLRDGYEPDEYQPRSIALGQTQAHNFYPAGDTDALSFLAKGGHFYRVFTSDLTPGVDTTLAVLIGGINYTNDDAGPGTLASEIRFQNPSGDLLAIVSILNRGDYGADKGYKVSLQEFLPTPTPDLRDSYEPDEAPPKAIAIGETQTHSFYPDGDMDKISFGVKAGRFYQAVTSNLAFGVDTSLTVTLNDKQWTNDDYAKPGSANFASAVCFQASLDGTAVAAITNHGQFGSSKTYQIKVTEVAGLTAVPCLPPATPSARQSSNFDLLRPAAAPTVDMTGVRFTVILELKATGP
ncbi:MAG: PilN domain-containing protein [Chloroflexi bacterium]|nr:PilN domain-containing protein [Chloroflexota bacterium]